MFRKLLLVSENCSRQKTVLNSFVRGLSTEKNNYDIVISGGGMVGSTLACTLGKNPLLTNKKILLLESSKKFQWKPREQYSNRVVALNPSTYNLLNKIGVWNGIADNRFGTVKKMQVWDGISDALITFDQNNSDSPVAYIVENDLLLSEVNGQLEKCSNVTVLNESKVKMYELPKSNGGEVRIEMENGDNYTCRLLLGCDGANSQVRKTMGTSYLAWNYDQVAVVATLHLQETEDNYIAWQRFIPTGPIALLPLKSNLSSLVWSTTPAHAKELLELPAEEFVASLNHFLWKVYSNSVSAEVSKKFDYFLQTFHASSNVIRQLPPSITSIAENSRASFPLGFGHAVTYIGNGVALVGDAAHRVHPLAGQGVNLGFGDVIAMNEILSENVSTGCVLGDISFLQDYQTRRQRHNLPTMLAIDGLQRLYGTELTPIVLLRSLGLQMVNTLNPLKKAIIQHAMV